MFEIESRSKDEWLSDGAPGTCSVEAMSEPYAGVCVCGVARCHGD